MFKEDYGHQGDVFFRSISELPPAATPKKNECLALGETSGHGHGVCGDVELFQAGPTVYAKVGPKGAKLIHTAAKSMIERNFAANDYPIADHLPIELNPNTTYEFGIHQRYNPYEKALETVAD